MSADIEAVVGNDNLVEYDNVPNNDYHSDDDDDDDDEVELTIKRRDMKTFLQLSSNESTLTRLNLEHDDLNEDRIEFISMALRLKNRTLVCVDIDSNRIGDRGAITFSKILPDTVIRIIHLRSNNIGPSGGTALAKQIQVTPSVRFVFLDNNTIGDPGAIAFSETLKAESQNLKELSLSLNRITDKGVAALTKASQHKNCTLEEVHLGGNALASMGAISFANYTFNKSVAHQQTLRFLFLEENAIGDTGAISLFQSLQKTNSVVKLEELHLPGNAITDKGATKIAPLLKNLHESIKVIWLYGNKISIEGKRALVRDGLRHNYSITELDLDYYGGGGKGKSNIIEQEHLESSSSGGNINENIANEMSFYLQLNRNGRRLLKYEKNEVHPCFWAFLMSKKEVQSEKSPSTIYYFLRENPDLLVDALSYR